MCAWPTTSKPSIRSTIGGVDRATRKSSSTTSVADARALIGAAAAGARQLRSCRSPPGQVTVNTAPGPSVTVMRAAEPLHQPVHQGQPETAAQRAGRAAWWSTVREDRVGALGRDAGAVVGDRTRIAVVVLDDRTTRPGPAPARPCPADRVEGVVDQVAEDRGQRLRLVRERRRARSPR